MYGLEAQDPDEFIANLFTLYPAATLATARAHRAELTNPPRTAIEHFAAYRQLGLVWLAGGLEDYLEII